MHGSTKEYLREHRKAGHQVLSLFCSLGKKLLLRSDVLNIVEKFCERCGIPGTDQSPLVEMLQSTQEALVDPPWVYLSLRVDIGKWNHVRLHTEEIRFEDVSVTEYLKFKEQLAGNGGPFKPEDWVLDINLAPFNRPFPRMQEPRSIGKGVEFLNRRLSSDLFTEVVYGDQALLDFLKVHQVWGAQLMLNSRIREVDDLVMALRSALRYLDGIAGDTEWKEVSERLTGMGFQPGWGRTVDRIEDTMRLLSDILEAPDHTSLEEFLSRIPMVFKIAIFSPHGFLSQSDVLGLPDTGGQIVYILNQVRALEQEMRQRNFEQGFDLEPEIMVITRLIPEARGTTCDQPTEQITGTQNSWIVRVPFREADGKVVPGWISRFEIWPYLERFASEAEREILDRFYGRPDLVIGNYSDGNLVATRIARRLRVTQCNVAHALEKTKYAFSDLNWKKYEQEYHFSAQFTADILAMNSADFIITSTYQEIAGDRETVGQYESYDFFTMPGLFRVTKGVDVYDPKFNIVSPGADSEVFFPYTDTTRRFDELQNQVRKMVEGEGDGKVSRGRLSDPSRPLLFTMSRLDRVKNVASLVDWYGRSSELRRLANLLVVGGHVDPAESDDTEELEQIQRLHELIEEHSLEGEIRWIRFQSDKSLVGELYRLVAERRGVFVHPALYEGFGLTIIESMSCGLPTFATCYGGPLEIIEDGISGFHIDPYDEQESVERIRKFLAGAASDQALWEEISKGGIERVKARYTWDLYAERMMTLARVYGFWNYITDLERDETRQYIDALYGLLYRPRAQSVERRK